MLKSLQGKAFLFLLLAVVYFFCITFFWKSFERPYMEMIIRPVVFIVNITQPSDPVSLHFNPAAKNALAVVPEIEAEKDNPNKPIYFFEWQWFQSNLAITMALILATPGIIIRRRLKILAVSFGILFLIHLFDVTIEVKRIYFNFYESIAVVKPSRLSVFNCKFPA